jgi:hypothetical protein
MTTTAALEPDRAWFAAHHLEHIGNLHHCPGQNDGEHVMKTLVIAFALILAVLGGAVVVSAVSSTPVVASCSSSDC